MASESKVHDIDAVKDGPTFDSKHKILDSTSEFPDAKATDDLIEPEDSDHGFDWTWKSLFRKPADLDATATKRSVFDDPNLAQYYAPGPEYENFKRFDPSERWTYREERSVRRKIDLHILLWVLIMFFALNIDRGNLGLAVAGGLLDDLKLSSNDYNNAQNMYRVGFIIAEIPSQLIGKKFGPDRWMPIQIIIWSICAGGQFFMQSRAGFFACRFFVGLFMGGFIPDSILYISYYYTSTEMPLRLALFWFTDYMSGVVASFIAYGVLHMENVAGREGWRWLFLIEALISIVIGFLSFFFLVPGPAQTKTLLAPNGYFTEREEKIITNKVLRDDPSKSSMHNRQAITPKMLWQSLSDYDLWPIYAIGILFEIPASPPKAYVPLSLKHLGFDAFQITLLNVPITVLIAINLLWVTALTERVGQIAIMGILTQLWVLPLLIIDLTSLSKISAWAQYAVTLLLVGQPSMQAAQVGWCSRISNTVRTRAVSACIYNIMIQLSGIASSNIYREDDKPLYHRGNKQLIAINVACIAANAAAKVYYTYRNKSNRAKWTAMTKSEQQDYLDTTKDQGNKRLDFVFTS
ncbi:putative transporter [Lachnellula occidentalis]|uniref:Putative transporter n=1 Tax=Lachnellula occidentalis TaxID=215460 RepID=A0A8H8UGI2_9HELO|nr:putative transporter [Lachnellula occidentalis]